jgi:hypothetical protein
MRPFLVPLFQRVQEGLRFDSADLPLFGRRVEANFFIEVHFALRLVYDWEQPAFPPS